MSRYLPPLERFMLDPSGAIQQKLPQVMIPISDDRAVAVRKYPDGYAFQFYNQCGQVVAIRLSQEAIDAALAGMKELETTSMAWTVTWTKHTDDPVTP